jgi:hypothetical protein
MWIFFTILCIIILLLTFIAVHKWRLTLQYKNGNFTVRVWRLTIYSFSVKRKKDKQYIKIPKINYNNILKKIKIFKQFYQDEKQEIAHILKETEKRAELKKLGISITFGFSDAAVTGIANGIIWGAVSGIVSFINKYVNIKDKTSIAVYPTYTKSCFDISVFIIFDTRLIKALYVARRAKKLYNRYSTEN